MHCNSKNFSELFPGLGGIASVKCNANGNKVSILVSKVRQSSSLTALGPDHQLIDWCSSRRLLKTQDSLLRNKPTCSMQCIWS